MDDIDLATDFLRQACAILSRAWEVDDAGVAHPSPDLARLRAYLAAALLAAALREVTGHADPREAAMLDDLAARMSNPLAVLARYMQPN